MSLLENKEYLEDIRYTASLPLPWDQLKNRSIMISGASGMIGSFLIDVLMYQNQKNQLHCRIYALGRNEEAAGNRFSDYWNHDNFQFIKGDINKGIEADIDTVDYVFHAASNTHPAAYASDPIGTVTTNIIGTDNLLKFASEHNCMRFVFASSNEIYGENRGDTELFDEKYCGYIDCNTMRAGYPESKRAGEALCQAYISQKGMDAVIARFTRTYGPTMKMSDTKAISQFIKKGIAGEDIVLKSEGNQYYSYTYVSDAVGGMLYVLLKGQCGEAYNISDQRSDIRLKDLAQCIADYTGKKVVFELPDALEASGYSKATKARLDSTKINTELGWKARYSMQEGLERTIDILKKECK